MLTFRESIRLQLPDVQESAIGDVDFKELYSPKHQAAQKGLVAKFAAIHEGRTANHRIYRRDELERATASWTQPYPKPLIVNHDTNSEPLGRITASSMATEEDGADFSEITVSILNPETVEKISDGRYQTGSVGGTAESAICNICGEDWAKKPFWERDCDHVPGKEYDGVTAGLIMRGITWREYSLVNVPADSQSRVLDFGHEEDSDNAAEHVDSLEYFVIPLHEEDIDEDNTLSFSESAEDEDNDSDEEGASNMVGHLNDENELVTETEDDEDETTNVEDEVFEEEEDDEDLLDVSESLSEDLAELAEDDDTDSEEEEEDADEDVDTQASDEEDEDEAEEDADSAEEDEEADEEDDAEEDTDSDEDDDEDDEPEEAVVADLEAEIEELKSENSDLKDVNERLRKALKLSLVERVVDAKIDRNLISRSDRGEAINEHAERTYSSLADSLKDVLSMPRHGVHAENESPDADDAEKVFEQDIEKESLAINEDGVEDADEDDVEEEVDEKSTYRDRVTNILHRQLNNL